MDLSFTGFAYCMDIRRRERSEYAVLFDGFSFTGKIIALNIVINLFVFLWSMLFVFFRLHRLLPLPLRPL